MVLPELDPVLATVLSGMLGLFVGSFLNVVIYRLPIMLERDWRRQAAEFLQQTDNGFPHEVFNLAVPRSACPHCGHQIRALENIPVFSYLMLRGRCRQCHVPISLRYPLVELMTAVLSAYTMWCFGFNWAGLGAVVFVWCMVALAFIDFDTQLLPDAITLPLLWLGLILNAGGVFVSPQEAVLGAVFGYMALWSVYWLFKLLTGKEGMGYGDFKLLAAIGAWQGWQVLPAVILVSSFLGAVIGVVLIVMFKGNKDKPIPFGPYLAVAGLSVLLFRLWFEQSLVFSLG